MGNPPRLGPSNAFLSSCIFSRAYTNNFEEHCLLTWLVHSRSPVLFESRQCIPHLTLINLVYSRTTFPITPWLRKIDILHKRPEINKNIVSFPNYENSCTFREVDKFHGWREPRNLYLAQESQVGWAGSKRRRYRGSIRREDYGCLVHPRNKLQSQITESNSFGVSARNVAISAHEGEVGWSMVGAASGSWRLYGAQDERTRLCRERESEGE